MVGGALGTTTGASVQVGTITKAAIAGVPVAKFAITAIILALLLKMQSLLLLMHNTLQLQNLLFQLLILYLIETVKIKTPINTGSTLLDGYGDYTVALAYHATMLKESIYIPTYVSALNKISNSTRYFEL